MDNEIYLYDNNRIKRVTSVDFSVWSNDEILEGSVFGKNSEGVNVPELYDNQEPKRGGLIDQRFGPPNDDSDCATCGLNNTYCVGHFGHISLAEPVFHMGYFQYVKKILSCICIRCSKLLVYKNESEIIDMLKNKSGKSRLKEIRNLTRDVTECKKAYSGCGAPVSKIKSEVKGSLVVTLYSEINLANLTKEEGGTEQGKKKNRQILTPELVYDILKNISDSDCYILGLDPTKSRPEELINKIFPVPPVQIRPSTRSSFTSSSTSENDLTCKLSDIVKANIRTAKHKETEGSRAGQEYHNLLQYHCSSYVDCDNSVQKAEQKGGRELKLLGSRIKGKDGRIRGNCMGKRVDFSGRTVITSDPTISISQLGVPKKMAMNLTVPEVVTPNNIDELTKLVKNGRDKYPGANYVFPLTTMQPGQKLTPIDLRFNKLELRYGYIVERHLKDGDVVLLNRQPTLHKMSMMAHKVKVIDNPNLLTLRLSVTVTTPYNADFDGDEMNLHVPQSIQTQTELEEVADVSKQIINPARSNTTIGIVQDGLIGSYKLTDPEIRIDRKNAMNIMAYTTIENFELFTEQAYSGYDLFSMILPSRINVNRGELQIKNGKLLSGRITKELLGAKKKNNLTQLIWDEYGVTETRNFLDNVQRLANNFNLYNGFTVGIGDATISPEIEEQINKVIDTKELKVEHMITEMENNPTLMDKELFERSLFAEISVIREDATKILLGKFSPYNNFNVMTISGSKGESINTGQISVCCGSQAFEGNIMPKKYNGRTLPYFFKDDDRAAARGFIRSSFVKGISFPDFIFLNIAAREGIIDQAIKTSESGYIQRRLIKSLEDVKLEYDCTVRTSTGSIIQLVYGDSGADTTRQYEYTMKMFDQGDTELEKLHKFNKEELKQTNLTEQENNEFFAKLISMRDELRISKLKTRLNYIVISNIYMLPINIVRIISNAVQQTQKGTVLDSKYVIFWLKQILEPENTKIMTMKRGMDKNSFKYKDDLLCKTAIEACLYETLSPKRCLFEYKFSKEVFDSIITEIMTSFNKNLAEPGEMVGILASQSMGEPTTQLSVAADSIVYINYDTDKQYIGPIGKFIDTILEIENTKPINNSYVLDLQSPFKILSVSQTEKLSWTKISQVSKHPPNGDLIRVTTKTGRFANATLSHSFLKKIENGIAPIKGSDLKVGDTVPISKNIPLPYETYKYDNIDLTYELGLECGQYLFRQNTNKFINKYFCDNIPGFVFSSNKNFIKGLINGVMNGQNKIKIEDNKLLNDIIILMGMINIYVNRDGNEIKIEEMDEGDIIWDEIKSIDIIKYEDQYVYDFTVPGTDSFMINDGMLVHNTLNAFHTAGIAVISATVQGVPRIRELLNLTKNPKTPQMIIYLKDEFRTNREMTNKIAYYIKFTALKDLRDNIAIYYDPEPNAKGGLMERDNVTKVFSLKTQSKNSCQSKITSLPWVMRIQLNRESMHEKEVTLLDIKSKICNMWEKRFTDKTIKRDEKEILDKLTQIAILSNSESDDIPIIHLRFDVTEFDFTIINGFIDNIIDNFKLKGIADITDISQKTEERVILYDGPDHSKEIKKQYVIYAVGTNLYGIRYIHGIDIYKTISNDIVAMYETFGIEAARSMLIREIIYAYERAGSGVNYHHVSILVDYMLFNGYMTSIDRHGMMKTSTGPLSRASFEKPVDQLLSAAVFSESDNMNSVSARIMGGLVINGGTGLCNIMLDTEMIQNSQFTEDIGQKYIKTYNEINKNNVMTDIIDSQGESNIFMPI